VGAPVNPTVTEVDSEVGPGYGGGSIEAWKPVGLENSVRRFELVLRLKRFSDQQLFLSAFK
jgi:hypothetical protein